MGFPSNSSAMEAMVRAAIQAETTHDNAKLSSDWRSTLEDMFIHPSISQDASILRDGNLISKSKGKALSTSL